MDHSTSRLLRRPPRGQEDAIWLLGALFSASPKYGVGHETWAKAIRRLFREARPDDLVVVMRLDQLGYSLEEIAGHLKKLAEKRLSLMCYAGWHAGQRLAPEELRWLHPVVTELARAQAKFSRAAGRPRKLTEPERDELLERERHGEQARDIAKALGISRATFYRELRELRELRP